MNVFSNHLDIGVLNIQVLKSHTQIDILRERLVVSILL